MGQFVGIETLLSGFAAQVSLVSSVLAGRWPGFEFCFVVLLMLWKLALSIYEDSEFSLPQPVNFSPEDSGLSSAAVTSRQERLAGTDRG